MRTTFLVTLILGGAVFARDMPNPPAKIKEAPDPRLDEVLTAWAKAQSSVRRSHLSARVTTNDGVTGSREKSALEVWYRKPDLLRLDENDDKGVLKFALYHSGKELHTFSNHQEAIYHLSAEFGFPENPERYPDTFSGGVAGALLERASWFGAGFPVKSLRERCDVRLTEDSNWTYLELRPRKLRDREEFQFVRVALGRKDMSLRQIFVRQSGQVDVTYDFEKSDTKTEVTLESITKGLPVGWERYDHAEKDFSAFQDKPNK